MRCRLFLALALLPILLSAAAAGEVRRGLAVASPVLGRPIPYTLYLPDDRAAGGRLPVLYLLHGHGGTERDWLDAGGLEAVIAMEDRNQILCSRSGDFREGIAAFLQKRPPEFSDT